MPISVKYTIARAVYKKQLRLTRELNDIHIFVSRAMPLLVTAAEDSEGKKIGPDEDMALRVTVQQEAATIGPCAWRRRQKLHRPQPTPLH